jgi:acetyl esterase/lipase
MKPSLLLLVLVSAFGALGAARAADTDVRVLREVAYLYGIRREKLDVYLPAPRYRGRTTPAIVYIHGGGWTGGDKGEARADEICGTLADAGYVVVSINYKLGDGAWPQNLMDCKNAVRFLRAKSKEYGVNRRRIAVAGSSAGAHLALLVGFTAGIKELEPKGIGTPYSRVSSAVRCVIDMYGPSSLLTREETDDQGKPLGKRKAPANSMAAFGSTDMDADVFRAASPVTYINRKSPPVLILHGMLDPQVDLGQSRTLAAALEAQGVEHEVVLVEGAGHSFDLETWNQKPMTRDLRPVALAFLAKHLGPPAKKR